MGHIVLSQNVSLDGVVQDPTGEEGFAFGGWFHRVADVDRKAWAEAEFEEAVQAEALLLGRRSDEYFATRWVGRTGDWADRLNSMPKYVVSSTLIKPRWGNSTVLSGDLVDEVSALKQRISGEIVVYGSGQLVHALMKHRLVDELRLMVYPSVAGGGERLFREGNNNDAMRLIETRTVGLNLALLVYRCECP